jgi:hypothetical protein
MTASSILVVEPHADDAFLSTGQHIEDWVKRGIRVVIVTVFSATRKRADDAVAYAKAVGAEWHGLGFIEGEPLPSDEVGADFPDLLPGTDVGKGWQVILPLGITHPEHVAVREWLEDCFNVQYYLDQPYAIIQKNGELVTDLLAGREVVSYRKPGIRKYRHIPLFKDQAKFYHYNPPEKLVQTCELIVGRRRL